MEGRETAQLGDLIVGYVEGFKQGTRLETRDFPDSIAFQEQVFWLLT